MRLVFCGGSQGLVLAARSQLYRGGLSSPASQPTASLFMGSTAIVTFSVRPQVVHSKVRHLEPPRAGSDARQGHPVFADRTHRTIVRRTHTPAPALDVHTLYRIGGGFQSRSERHCRGRIGRAGRAKMPACVASPPSPRPPTAGPRSGVEVRWCERRRVFAAGRRGKRRSRRSVPAATRTGGPGCGSPATGGVSCADGPRVTTTASPRNGARCEAALLLFRHNLEIPLRERWTRGRKQVILRHCQQSVVRRGACPEFSDYSSKSFSRPS